MIKTVNGAGRYVMVNGGFPATTYINTSSGYMNVGDVRFNTNMQMLEVYDGNRWVEMNTSHASVGLTPEAEMALDWAIKKKNEDMVLENLAKSNPTIADLINQKKELDDKNKMVQTLMKEEVKVGTN
jgi:uncharacterized radical SAM superfamily protein